MRINHPSRCKSIKVGWCTEVSLIINSLSSHRVYLRRQFSSRNAQLEQSSSLLPLFSMKHSGAIACCLLIAIVAVNAWPSYKRAEVRAHVRNCVKKTGIPGKNALKVLKGNFNDDSSEVKKFMKCMFQEVGFINEKDELLDNLLIAKIKENLEEDEADELIEKCSIVGDDINDTAFQIYKCYYENHDLPPDMLVR
ncbi:general odorant-binding protein 56d [Aedes aegypti]|uniref:Uncharacterized protein n=2 Tax=Aedes aegypti TaxID=7159 RepID=A0A903TTT3_AEDAE|nr:general odorant-binding protein 56d [Aedes aegypti]